MITSSNGYNAVLMRHPETHSQAVHRIEARVGWEQSGAIAVAYILRGDINRLKIPPPLPPRRADRLWQHTCFEAFVSVRGSSAYYEFNFAPSGEWAAYTFRSYRAGGPLVDEELDPRITARSAKDSLELHAIIRLDRLPAIRRRAWLQLGLSAVIEEEGGILSYWALKHLPGKADFHHPDAFTLEVAPPDVAAVNEPAMEKR